MLLPICLSTALVPLNSTTIVVALPDLGRDLRVGPAAGLALITSYLVVAAAVQPVAGTLGDRLGPRATVLGGTVAFGALSVAAAVAATLPLLVALRCLQAAAGALALPNAAGLVRTVVSEERRGRALGLVGAAATLAAAAGPPLGGLLTAAAGWRAVFLLNVPFVIAAVVTGSRALPRTAPTTSGRFDVVGALLLLGGLGGGATLLTTRPDGTALFVGAVAVVSTWLVLLPHELRTDHPVLDPRIFRRRPVAAGALAAAGSNLSLYVLLLAVPVLIGEGDPAAVGLILLPLPGAICLLSPLGGLLSDRVGRRTPALVGLGLLSATLLVLLVVGRLPTTPLLVLALGLAGAGLGIALAPVQAAALDAVEPGRAGMVSGAWSTSRYLGSITGSAVLAALWREQPAAVEPALMLAAAAAVLSFLATLALQHSGSPPADRTGAWSRARPRLQRRRPARRPRAAARQ